MRALSWTFSIVFIKTLLWFVVTSPVWCSSELDQPARGAPADRRAGVERGMPQDVLGADGWTLTDFTAFDSSRISCVGEARGEVDINGRTATFIAWVELVPCGGGWHRGSVYQTLNSQFRANAGRMWNCEGD